MNSCLARRVFGAVVCVLSLFVLTHVNVLSVKHVLAGIDDTGILDSETVSTNPKPRTGIVSATVADNIPPTVPILISPENNSLLSTNLFPFIWRESTDERGISKYELYLDGVLLFDNISGDGDNTTAQYVHTSDSGISTLTPVSGLSDGQHTWKIIAYDGFLPIPNSASSATWTFTIDTSSPAILITKVGNVVVSISSQDISTVPTTPIVLYENEPVIVGSTEGGAHVKVSFTTPGDANPTILTTTAAGDGSFSFTLPSLPRDVTIELTFTATDGAGNSSIIENVPILIKTVYITVPPPLKKIIPPIPVPTREEIKQEVAKQVEKAIEVFIPFVPAEYVQDFSQYVDNVSPVANSLIGFIIPLLRLAIALFFANASLSLISVRVLRKAAHALYLLPPQERLGLVYDVDTNKGIAYAMVKIFPVKDRDNMHIEMSTDIQEYITDADGLYGPVSLSPGQYTVEVQHRHYTYIARERDSRNSDNETLYKGEIFVTDDKHKEIYFMIPVRNNERIAADGAVVDERHENLHVLRLLARRFSLGFARLPNSLLIPVTILMALIAFFYFTIWNVVMLLLYAYTLSKRAARRTHLPTLVGGVLDQFGDPLSLAFVRVKPSNHQGKQQHVMARAVQADDLGKFAFVLKPGFYTIQASWFDGSTTEWMEIELQKSSVAVALSIHTGNTAVESPQEAEVLYSLSSQPTAPQTA